MEVIGNPVHAGVFELARRFRRGASMAELVEASGLPERSLQASVDALAAVGLVRRVSARRAPRVRYAATCKRIAIVADPDRADHVKALHAHFRTATDDVARVLRDGMNVTGALADGQHRIAARLKLELKPSEWPEFLRLTRSLLDFLENVAQSRTAGERVRDQRCDHVLSLWLAPTKQPMLPGPSITVVGRERSRPRGTEAIPDGLTPREREVATLASVGVRRNDIAGRLGVSSNTVATLLRRAYRKLKVSDRQSLALRLARAGAPGR